MIINLRLIYPVSVHNKVCLRALYINKNSVNPLDWRGIIATSAIFGNQHFDCTC